MNDDVNDDAPWFVDCDAFSQCNDLGYIAKSVGIVKDNRLPLTLVADGGKIFQQSLLTNITDGLLQIDKPLEWDDEIYSFRAFFRDMQKKWNFFPVNIESCNPFSISVAMPETLSFLQRRSCGRIKVPSGTRALVRNGNDVMSTVFVHDLSAAGMLICNGPAEYQYSTDTIISDIVVSIPPGASGGEVATARKVLPLINQGKVVRSFVDKKSHRSCHGISFHYDSSYVRETIDRAISEVEREVLSGDCSVSN